jgi:hypothetical protein
MKKASLYLALFCIAHSAAFASLNDCNVIWDSPSKDSFDTMPLSGSHGAGDNVWFQDGALWLYLCHNGAQDVAGPEQLCKLGALRITPVGMDAHELPRFRQELELPSGSIRMVAEAPVQQRSEFLLWFSRETVVIETRHSEPITLKIEYGSWRARPHPGAVHPERVETNGGVLSFVHRNGPTQATLQAAKAQSIPAQDIVDFAADRVFGFAMAARGGLAFEAPVPVEWQLWKGHAWPMRTQAADSHLVTVALGAGQHADPDQWRGRARQRRSWPRPTASPSPSPRNGNTPAVPAGASGSSMNRGRESGNITGSSNSSPPCVHRFPVPATSNGSTIGSTPCKPPP